MSTTQQPIELKLKSSWEAKDSFIVDTCPNKSVALIASSNHVTLRRYSGEITQKSAPFEENVVASSLHPSGRHILIGFTDKLCLANVLLNGIEIFWHEKVRLCVDCKFNPITGTIFAAICGVSIEVYDFVYGRKLRTIDCNNTSFDCLRWGRNCTVHAMTDEGTHLCKWDALSGEKLSEFKMDGDRINSYYVARDDSVFITSSNNSIILLSRQLKYVSAINVSHNFILCGPIVSGDGLVFVSMCQLGETNGLVRIYRTVDWEYFDQTIERAASIMRISHDGKYLVTNAAVFQVQDRRGYSQTVITACLDDTEDDVISDKQETDVLVSENYVDSREILLRDLQSRLTELELTNELHLQTVRDGHRDELVTLIDGYDAKIEEEKREHVIALEKRDQMSKSKRQMMQETKHVYALEMKQQEDKHKDLILNHVNSHCKIEQEWEEEKRSMEERLQRMERDNEHELIEFRTQAEIKLSKQMDVTTKLAKEIETIQRMNKEMIAQLEDDIDEQITQMTSKFENEIKAEHESSEMLVLENGILTRRLTSTQETMDDLKERVAALLENEKDLNKMVAKKEIEKENTVTLKRTKELEIGSKEEAVSRLVALNKQLHKTRSIEEDKLEEAKIYQNGPRKERKEQIDKEIRSKVQCLEEQKLLSSTMEEQIAELKQSIEEEKKRVSKLEIQIRGLDGTIQKYLIGLQNCTECIQKPAELRRIIVGMSEISKTRRPASSAWYIPQQTNNNESHEDVAHTTLCLVEKTNELNSLKAEDIQLMEKYKKERVNQVAANSAVLDQISALKDGPTAARRRKSSLCSRKTLNCYSSNAADSEAANVLNNNMQHIRALQGNSINQL